MQGKSSLTVIYNLWYYRDDLQIVDGFKDLTTENLNFSVKGQDKRTIKLIFRPKEIGVLINFEIPYLEILTDL